MSALESLVLDPLEALPVRLSAGKLRLCIQASIRHDDLTNTPLASCEWVRKPGEEAIVGLRSRTVRGKTGQRLWVASLRGATEAGDGWLVRLMSLALTAHGATWRSDDHFGKDSNKERTGFLCFPPTLEGDVTLVKEGLSRAVQAGHEVGMTLEEIGTLRWHGAKSTMPSIMQHLGLKPLAVRFQGAWASQMDTMPDTYLREAQTLVLEAQERCLSYLRGGGDLIRLLGTPIGDEGDEVGVGSRHSGAAEAAMAAPARFAADEGSLALEFFDEAFTEQGWDRVAIGEEVRSLAEVPERPAEGLVAEDRSLGNGPSSSESEASTDRPLPEPTEPDPLDWMDRVDSEGMTSCFVQVVSPGPKSRLHLAGTSGEGRDLQVEAAPKCGANGKYGYVQADEALDMSGGLCGRCWPVGSRKGCLMLCGHMAMADRATVLRCTRLCAQPQDSHDEHRCAVHSAEAAA